MTSWDFSRFYPEHGLVLKGMSWDGRIAEEISYVAGHFTWWLDWFSRENWNRKPELFGLRENWNRKPEWFSHFLYGAFRWRFSRLNQSIDMGNPSISRYHLVMTNSLPWKITIFNGNIHYFNGPFSMAILNNQRVIFTWTPPGFSIAMLDYKRKHFPYVFWSFDLISNTTLLGDGESDAPTQVPSLPDINSKVAASLWGSPGAPAKLTRRGYLTVSTRGHMIHIIYGDM